MAGTGGCPAAHEQLARRPYTRGTGQRVQGPGYVAQGPGGGQHVESGEGAAAPGGAGLESAGRHHHVADLGAVGFQPNNRHRNGATAQHRSQRLEADEPRHQRQGPGDVPRAEAKSPQRVGAGPIEGRFQEDVGPRQELAGSALFARPLSSGSGETRWCGPSTGPTPGVHEVEQVPQQILSTGSNLAVQCKRGRIEETRAGFDRVNTQAGHIDALFQQLERRVKMSRVA